MNSPANFSAGRFSRNKSAVTSSIPATRRLPSRDSKTGRRVRLFSCAIFTASRNGELTSTKKVFASGIVICATVKCCRSSTRLTIACSSLVSACAASAITARISSRLPNSRPVKAREPRQRRKICEMPSTKKTSGASARCTKRKTFADERHSRFGYARNSIFGSKSKNA